MDENHPNRKKDRLNPYTLYIENNAYYISFTDGQGVYHKQEITLELYSAFNRFELDDISWINEKNRHVSGRTCSEGLLECEIIDSSESLEEYVHTKILHQKVREAIEQLSEIQRRRVKLYYFEGYTYEQIAQIEGCTHPAIMKSIKVAEQHIRDLLK